ncbi:MAG: sialidase family protein [Candidatus Aminicenantes bacterium]|nr:sialidase family protein [Candidatus Aminicenantes bacterium]
MSALSLEQGPNYNSNQTMPRAILLLMLSWNDWGNYPGGRILRRGRQYLHVAISSDDGKTWSPSRLIAGPSTPDPENAQMRYPFLCQTGDGSVLLRYHRIERTLGIARRDLLRIDPEWIAESSTKPGPVPRGR